MSESDITIGAATFFSVIALISVVFWIRTTITGFARHRERTLVMANVSLLAQWGSNTTIALMAAALAFWGISLSLHHLDAVSVAFLIVSGGLLLGLCVVLWLITRYLYDQAREPIFVYLLPRDADKVRRDQCEQGIAFVAHLYPRVIVEADFIDVLPRAMQVPIRRELYPKRKKDGLQLTNDFAVYCNLCSEGFGQGYTGFLAACQAEPDRLEHVRTVLKQWPETKESEQLMSEFVSKIFSVEREEK